jgi:hypothetical protein
MGGLEAGPVDLTEAAYAPWQKRVKALALLLIRGDKAQMNVERLGYYERWTRSIADILTEKGLFTAEELTVKMAEVEKRWQEQGPK